MRKCIIVCVILTLITLFSACNRRGKPFLSDEELQFIKCQFENTLAAAVDPVKIPRSISKNGKLITVDIYDWTSGFFAGNLWQLYNITRDEKWKQEAVKWTEILDSIQYFSNHHDVGFMINCSYGNGLKLTGKKDYEKVMIQSAKSLIKRYSPVTKCIKSWNHRKAWDGKTEWFYPVIIDNMMNLELLFKATLLSGDSIYQNIAVQHAMTTMKNHYRDDYSCFHVVDYDATSGQVLDKATCQGFVDKSSWARGQAWGLYGFTICYRYTKDDRFLKFAENIAGYIINHPNLSEDMVPYWDYNVGDKGLTPEWNYDATKYPKILRDASAAAITSSALFELSGYSKMNGDKYYNVASKMLKSLSSPAYMASSSGNKYFILNHCVGSIPHGFEIDVPLVYADYYFLEALIRKKHLGKVL
jgi:unsaturated chondroitin disaccharide hydrolase